MDTALEKTLKENYEYLKFNDERDAVRYINKTVDYFICRYTEILSKHKWEDVEYLKV